MARRASQFPTELELEILKILWRQGEGSVRQVREQLSGFRDLAHTSVMTMMGIMTVKGYLKRTKKSKGYIYKPRVSKEQTARKMLGDMVDRVFHGSTMAAMVHLLEIGDIDDKELTELQRLIRQKENR